MENDLKGFLEGDQTETQQRHITFTRAQKVRIALARAVYSNADIYLFDDPLSVLDTGIAEKIYEEVILKMLKNKTRLMITSQTEFMKDVQNIIVMDKGRVLGQGNYEEIEEQGIDIQDIFACYDNQRKTSGPSLENLPSLKDITRFPLHDEASEKIVIREKHRLPYNKSELRVNKVTFRTYKEYVKSYGSSLLFTITIIFFVLTQGIIVTFAYDLKLWVTWA